MITMQNNKALKDKYAHLEFSILPLSKALKDNETKRLDSEYFKKEYLENEELLKCFECQTLEELSTKITNGHTPYGENLLENEVKFITAEFIDDFTINKIKKFISMKSHSSYLKRSILNEGDIIFSIKGKIGNAVPIFDIQEPLNINQDVAKISLKNKINHFYVSAFLNSKYGKKQTEAEATGQINPFISLGVLKKIKIPIFDSSFQAEIEKIVKDSHHKLEQSKSLYKEAEGLLYESITNSPLTQDNKFFSNANGGESMGDFALDSNDSMESNAKSSENNPVFASETKQTAPLPSLRGSPQGLTRQSINKNNSCEAQPLLAPLRGSEIEEMGGGVALFTKKSDYINENISAESRRIERAESFTKNAESQGDSSHSMQSTLQNLKARFPHLNISIKPLSKSLRKSGRLDSEYYQAKYENIEALIKQNGFKTLQEICSLINYGSVPTSPYTNSSDGVPYIKGLNLKNLEVSEDKLDKITNTQGLHSKFFTKENDIIISQMGTVGDCGVVSKSQENYIFASFTIRVRLKDTKEFNPYFVALYIQNIAKEHYLQRNIAQASVRQNTDLPTIKNLYVPLVDSQIQEQIASRLKLSFALKKEAKELLDLAKSKVENAIEGKIP